MVRTDWPSKAQANRWEIEGFISHYRRLPGDRSFEIVRKHERPDWIVRDSANGAFLGVELTSVYLDDRSVPDVHKREGPFGIQCNEQEIAAYGARVVAAAQKKVRWPGRAMTRAPRLSCRSTQMST
jgi:hypothetical protein